MKRRDFSLALGAAAGASWVQTPALAQVTPPVAGNDYLVLEKPAPVEALAGKIEIIEFFWYSCPHCNVFEPTLAAWIKRMPKDVSVRRVPVAFRDDFVPQQRLYYALEALGLVETHHGKVFTAIHGEKLNLNSAEAISNWAAKQGIDKAKFMAQFNSFAVANKATKGTQLQNAYKVEGVPAIGVAGRFYTDGTFAKSMDRALVIAEYLAAEIRKKK
jgi:thiol:disulfide interchange protein DsbA